MSLRKIVAALALCLAMNAMIGGGGNRVSGPGHPLGLFRLASLCPRGSDYRHPGILGRKSRQNPLLRR